MKKTRCYTYTRVSTANQVDGFSLDAQKDKLLKYANFQEMIVCGEYSDEGKSGKNIEGRTDFVRMLDDIKSQKNSIDYVLVFKLSRFGRNAADVLTSLQQMEDYGVNLICVEDGIDSSKDSGKLIISVLSAVAEIERENILVQTMEGRKQKAREGKWNGGFAPYGYKLVDGFLEIDEEEAEIIRIIFDRYIHTSMGTTRLAKYLNEKGYVKKIRQNNTLNVFTQPFVTKVLDNPVYCGKITYGRRRNEKIVGKHNEYHVVKQESYDLFDGAHDAIISEEDFELAKKKRNSTSGRTAKKYSLEHANILTGMLKCPCCGENMYCNINRKKNKKTGEVTDRFYYQCNHKRYIDASHCTYRKSWRQNVIDDAVANYISQIVKQPIFENAIKEKIESRVDNDELVIEKGDLKKRLRKLIATKEKAIIQFNDLDVADEFYDMRYEDHEKRITEIYKQIRIVEEQLDEINERILNNKQNKLSADRAYEYLLKFNELYGKATDTEKKEFMNTIIRKIEIYEDQQEDSKIIKRITFKFPIEFRPNENDSCTENDKGELGVKSLQPSRRWY